MFNTFSFSSNLTLWVPMGITIGVQIIKFLWESVRDRQISWVVLFRTGGMPSSHSAMVTSLATAVARREGTGSALFAATVVLAVIVMHDARGIRQESGKQARVLNRIVRELFTGHPVTEDELKELLGHTILEVLIGGLVGVVFTIVALDWFSA